MNWTALLKSELEETFRATEGLMDLVDEDKLDWVPETGENWMPTRQLLRHLTNACGWCAENFVEDRWAAIMAGDGSDAPPSDVQSVAEAKAELAKDKARALATVEKAGEEALASKMLAAPWDPTERPLGQHVLQMIGHLNTHKAQLFYYLKLQGKPVNTFTMWGIPEPQADAT
ncbi:MAG: DinB family protein [Planctomycetota bacterium]|nr:DinB family protein [Planctomycetota bacterium]